MSYDRRTLYGNRNQRYPGLLIITHAIYLHLNDFTTGRFAIKVDPLYLELLIQAIKHFRSQVPQSKFEANR